MQTCLSVQSRPVLPEGSRHQATAKGEILDLNTDDCKGLSNIEAESSIKAESNIKAESSIKAEIEAEPMKEEPIIEESTADSRVFTGTFQHPATNTWIFMAPMMVLINI